MKLQMLAIPSMSMLENNVASYLRNFNFFSIYVAIKTKETESNLNPHTFTLTIGGISMLAKCFKVT